MSHLAPIAFFVYNRPRHTKISLKALEKNTLAKKSDLIIFSEGPKKNKIDKKKVEKVRNVLKEFKGFKSVTIKKRKKNYGLYKNFVKGITEVCEKYGSVIVIEDDNFTSQYFLNFINDGLRLYKNEKRVCSINGWFFPGQNKLEKFFFLKGGDTWGWGTWKRAWDQFNPNTKHLLNEIKKKNKIKEFNLNNSFDYYKMLQKRNLNQNESHTIIWKASTFLRNMYSLYPYKTFVKNIGFDGSGTHSKNKDHIHEHKSINNHKIILKKIYIKNNIKALKYVERFYKIKHFKNLFLRIKNKIINF